MRTSLSKWRFLVLYSCILICLLANLSSVSAEELTEEPAAHIEAILSEESSIPAEVFDPEEELIPDEEAIHQETVESETLMEAEPEFTVMEPEEVIEIMPAFRGVISEDDLRRNDGIMLLAEDGDYFESVEEAAEYLRSRLVQRDTSIIISFISHGEDSALRETIWNAALSHTGVPDEGDYLKWNLAAVRRILSGFVRDNDYYYTFTYEVTQLTDRDQEDIVDQKIAELLEQLDLENRPALQQIRIVYDYICQNTKYDYDHDSSYLLKHSTYAALIDHTCVCQGYSTLLYRMMLELGIDSRIISGEDHGWNIVQLEGRYYYMDATWDSERLIYTYYLMGSADFLNHYPSSEYTSAEFRSHYPVSPAAFKNWANAPQNLSGSAVNTTVHLQWDVSVPAEKYLVYDGEKLACEAFMPAAELKNVSSGTHTYLVRPFHTNDIGQPAFGDFSVPLDLTVTLNTPVLIQAKPVNSGIRLEWSPVPGAEKYRVFYRTTGSWIRIGDTDQTEFTATGLASGASCTFTVRCITEDGTAYTSDYDHAGLTVNYSKLPTPVLTSAACVNGGINVMWSAVPGAQRYRVFYKSGTDSWHLAGDTTSTSRIVTGLTSGTEYTFTVRCLDSDGTYSSSYDPAGIRVMYLSSPVLKSAENANGGVSVKWNAVPGAQKYRVFYKSGAGSWRSAGDTFAASYTVTGLISGTKYTFTVRCISSDSKIYTSSYDPIGINASYIAAPALTSAANVGNGINVRWNTVSGASKYRVFYKAGSGGWTKAADTSGNNYTVTGLASGTAYTFTVRCLSADGKSYISSYDSTGKTAVYSAYPVLASVSSVSNGVTVKWNAMTGAAKYRVFCKTANSSWKSMGDTTGTSYTATGLTRGTTYTFTVRCISADGKSFTSAYDSTGLSVRIP